MQSFHPPMLPVVMRLSTYSLTSPLASLLSNCRECIPFDARKSTWHPQWLAKTRHRKRDVLWVKHLARAHWQTDQRSPGTKGSHLHIAARSVCNRDRDPWSEMIGENLPRGLDHSLPSSRLLVACFYKVQRTKLSHASFCYIHLQLLLIIHILLRRDVRD